MLNEQVKVSFIKHLCTCVVGEDVLGNVVYKQIQQIYAYLQTGQLSYATYKLSSVQIITNTEQAMTPPWLCNVLLWYIHLLGYESLSTISFSC